MRHRSEARTLTAVQDTDLLERLSQRLFGGDIDVLGLSIAIWVLEGLNLVVIAQSVGLSLSLLVPALREMGFGVPVTPSGGFFVYADCSRFSESTGLPTCTLRSATRLMYESVDTCASFSFR